MKNYISKIFIGLGLITLVVACKKTETFPVDKISGAYVFDVRDSAGTSALQYLLNVYSILPYGHNRVNGDYLDAASDDAVSAAVGGQVSILATGSYNSISLPSGEDVWSTVNSTNTANYWNGIRYANEFIANIGVVPVKGALPNGVGTRYVWKSEARFLRAFFYFELVKRFGGVPLLGDKVYNINDNIALPRNNFSDCIKYIVGECDAIKDSLITVQDYNPTADNYRVTLGADLALKARVLMYAASPLFNDPAGNGNPLTGYPSYDATRWSTALAAVKDVMNLNSYQLDPSFKNIFLTQNDPEVLFLRTTNNASGSTNVEFSNGPPGFATATGAGITNPTQDLVDSYPMANGLAITDPASGYDPNNPYANRDPRFGYTVLYNGAPWLGTSLQTYEGGQSKPNSGQQQTVTGYYMRKFMGNDETGSTYQNHDEDWVIFRYAEIKLDYAEAENEIAGSPGPDVYQQLKDLRLRAGIAKGNDGSYGLAANMTKSQMRTTIQNERRIEMAFEEQRYFDLKRWKLSETVMNKSLTGVSITNSNGNLTYNYIPVLTAKFIAPKMYLYPIPYQEVLKNPNMKQNPGW
jgi:hypothetical protein